jgi:hypothetical protein
MDEDPRGPERKSPEILNQTELKLLFDAIATRCILKGNIEDDPFDDNRGENGYFVIIPTQESLVSLGLIGADVRYQNKTLSGSEEPLVYVSFDDSQLTKEYALVQTNAQTIIVMGDYRPSHAPGGRDEPSSTRTAQERLAAFAESVLMSEQFGMNELTRDDADLLRKVAGL